MVEPSSTNKCCPASRVVTLTGVRIAGLSSFSSPPSWKSVVGVAFVKLSRVNMLLVLKERYDVPGDRSLCI